MPTNWKRSTNTSTATTRSLRMATSSLSLSRLFGITTPLMRRQHPAASRAADTEETHSLERLSLPAGSYPGLAGSEPLEPSQLPAACVVVCTSLAAAAAQVRRSRSDLAQARAHNSASRDERDALRTKALEMRGYLPHEPLDDALRPTARRGRDRRSALASSIGLRIRCGVGTSAAVGLGTWC